MMHPTLSMLHGCEITVYDKYIYVSSRNTNGDFSPHFQVAGENAPGTICILDTQTEEIVKVIEIEEFVLELVAEK